MSYVLIYLIYEDNRDLIFFLLFIYSSCTGESCTGDEYRHGLRQFVMGPSYRATYRNNPVWSQVCDETWRDGQPHRHSTSKHHHLDAISWDRICLPGETCNNIIYVYHSLYNGEGLWGPRFTLQPLSLLHITLLYFYFVYHITYIFSNFKSHVITCLVGSWSIVWFTSSLEPLRI